VRARREDGTVATIDVSGTPRSYRVVDDESVGADVLTIEVDPGVEVYSFTFG